MRTTVSGRLTLPVLLALVGACGRDAPAPTPAPTPSAAAAPVAPAEAVRQVVLRSVALGKSINPDGSVAAAVDTFTPGEPLFVSLDVQPISPGTEVHLAWRGPTGQDHGEEELVVPAGARVVNFKARDTSGWPAGEHRLEVSLGGALVGSKPFRIVGAAAAASPSASPR
jgi:hypothetical protein